MNGVWLEECLSIVISLARLFIAIGVEPNNSFSVLAELKSKLKEIDTYFDNLQTVKFFSFFLPTSELHFSNVFTFPANN